MVRFEGRFYRGERTVGIETTTSEDIDGGIVVLGPGVDRHVGFRDDRDRGNTLRGVLTCRQVHERGATIVHGLTESLLDMLHCVQVLASPELDEDMDGEGFHGSVKDRKG